MKCFQAIWSESSGWKGLDRKMERSPDIFLVFGGIDELSSPTHYATLRNALPGTDIVFCSTAGEISGSVVQDNSLVGTGICLEKSRHRAIELDISECAEGLSCGRKLRQLLEEEELKHIFVISDGTLVNGDRLAEGLRSGLNPILVSGGLAADAGRFSGTLVGLNGNPKPGKIVAIGYYGDNFRVSCGSQGGWDEFGPERKVTKSEGNVLFEIDGQSALGIYKNYLGDKAAELPGSALLFPLSLRTEVSGEPVVRTILAINEDNGSMTFAGDIPEGSTVRLMMANFDRLIEGATDAAERTLTNNFDPALVLMISCVGRKIVLGPRVEEETESVVGVFGNGPVYAGFYSNGEISPLVQSAVCSLHNQTMTITAYAEG